MRVSTQNNKGQSHPLAPLLGSSLTKWLIIKIKIAHFIWFAMLFGKEESNVTKMDTKYKLYIEKQIPTGRRMTSWLFNVVSSAAVLWVITYCKKEQHCVTMQRREEKRWMITPAV